MTPAVGKAIRWRAGMLVILLLAVFAAVVSLLWLSVCIIAGSRPRAWSIAVGYDQLGNAATGGDEDETISSRCWRWQDRQPFRFLRWAIDWAAARIGDPDHCRTAWETEKDKAARTSQVALTDNDRSMISSTESHLHTPDASLCLHRS